MNMLKLTAAAALVAASLSASAMSTISDEEMSTVAGQDGVSIAANLNINIGSFSYTNTNSTAGSATATSSSVNFNNISITGLVAMTIDVISNASFKADIVNSSTALVAPGVTAGQALWTAVTGTTGYGMTDGGSDVVQFAFPKIGDGTVAHGFSPTISVGNIKMSGSDASFGSVTIKNLDLQGTQVWMWAH